MPAIEEDSVTTWPTYRHVELHKHQRVAVDELIKVVCCENRDVVGFVHPARRGEAKQRKKQQGTHPKQGFGLNG